MVSEDRGLVSVLFLRGFSFVRIILFGMLTILSSLALIECYIASGHCNIFTVLSSSSMIVIDIAIIKWGEELQQWYYLGYLLVSLLTMFVAIETMVTIIWSGFIFPRIDLVVPSNLPEQLVRVLSYGVIVISFTQMMSLIYLTSPQKLKQNVDEEDKWLQGSNQ
jgi:hypothetical protein